MLITFSYTNQTLLTHRQLTRRNHTLVHLALLSGVALMFIPLAWTISTSRKTPSEVFLFPPKWIPSKIRWSNYREAVVTILFWLYLYNTTLITVLSIVGKMGSIILVAFAFEKFLEIAQPLIKKNGDTTEKWGFLVNCSQRPWTFWLYCNESFKWDVSIPGLGQKFWIQIA